MLSEVFVLTASNKDAWYYRQVRKNQFSELKLKKLIISLPA